MEAATDNAKIQTGDTGLHIDLPSGNAYFNYFWLRDNCPTNFDPATNEKVFDITETDRTPTPATVRSENGELVINWSGEDHVTRYKMSFLENFRSLGRLPDPAAITRRLWYAGHHKLFTRLSQESIENSPETLARFARALIEDGVAIVTGMEDTDESLTRLAHTLGEVTPSTSDGIYFDVKMEIAPTNLAFTAKALEMHTDLPSEQAAPGVQFLHCRANTVEGGNNLFLDGAAVAEELRENHPEDFKLLAEHEIPFFRRHNNWDCRAYQRVIELDRDGAVSGVTISQHLSDPFDLPQELLDDYYPAFCRFIRLMKDEKFMNRFRLQAGECIVFDNHRIVHGREAFNAKSGKRHLRGCYVDRGAVRSTYRTLVKQGHAEVAQND